LKELVKKKYPEHCHDQYGAKYLDFIGNLVMNDGHLGEVIMKELNAPEGKVYPPKWYEFLRQELGDERFKKLEIIRRDPQFSPYIEYRKSRFEQYKQSFMSRTTTEQEQKQFNNMKMYVEQLATYLSFLFEFQLIFQIGLPTISKNFYILTFMVLFHKSSNSLKRILILIRKILLLETLLPLRNLMKTKILYPRRVSKEEPSLL